MGFYAMPNPLLKFSSWLPWAAILIYIIPNSKANWDEATGHIRDYKPTDAWLSKNSATVVTPDIQASECGRNTRLPFPHVQLFAYFEVNHGQDCYHGCPYGKCYAYVTFPQPGDLEPAFTDGHCFFWHNLGGRAGPGVKPISNPQTGAYGWEDSINGKYYDGKPNYSRMQKDHDEHYPHWGQIKMKLKPWPGNAASRVDKRKKEPYHPKCGTPCGPNKDPGSIPGAYGNYHPADAREYSAPKGWENKCK